MGSQRVRLNQVTEHFQEMEAQRNQLTCPLSHSLSLTHGNLNPDSLISLPFHSHFANFNIVVLILVWCFPKRSSVIQLYSMYSPATCVYTHTHTLTYVYTHISGKVKVKVTQSCLTLCNPMDCSLPGSSVHGIFQTRILEWATVPFSRGSSQPRDWTQVYRGGRFRNNIPRNMNYIYVNIWTIFIYAVAGIVWALNYQE